VQSVTNNKQTNKQTNKQSMNYFIIINKMIPYSIQHTYPTDDVIDNSIFTNHNCLEKSKLNETLIHENSRW
jgi:hypothetical protein